MQIVFENDSVYNADVVVLRKSCPFPELFERTKNVRRPEMEEAYSRSDYHGHWWTTWFPVYPASTKEQIAEINDFHNSFFELPEFKNLNRMVAACDAGKAEPTGYPSEYNLFSETEHFNIFIRLVTRYRDYNLYMHYFRKN